MRIEHSGMVDKVFNGIPSKSIVNISGMGVVTIIGTIHQGTVINISEAANVVIKGDVKDFVKFNLSDVSQLTFFTIPPQSVRLDGIELLSGYPRINCVYNCGPKKEFEPNVNAQNWNTGYSTLYRLRISQTYQNSGIKERFGAITTFVKGNYRIVVAKSLQDIIVIINNTRTLYKGDSVIISDDEFKNDAELFQKVRIDGFRLLYNDPRKISEEDIRCLNTDSSIVATQSVTNTVGTLFATSKHNCALESDKSSMTNDSAIQCDLIK